MVLSRSLDRIDRSREGARAVPQEQEQKKTQKRSGGGSDDEAGQVSSASKGEKLKEEMDDILDEIDSVLEENAEEFVKSYVQKGGE
jgi:ubiquitin-like protein Pup